MVDISDNAKWSELDASNASTPPDGWPEGMMPADVNDTARADRGALKRFWDKINPVQAITPASGVWTFTTSNSLYPAAYVDGEAYSFRPLAASGAGDQFAVNVLPPKPILKAVSGGIFAAIGAGDIALRQAPTLVYDNTLNSGAGAFVLTNPYLPVTSGGGISVPGPINSTGLITSTGPGAGLGFVARDDGSAQWLWYASGGAARLSLGGADKAAIYSNGNMAISGIIYAGLEGHAIAFGWDGTGIVGHVDGTGTPGRLVAWGSSPTLVNISCNSIAATGTGTPIYAPNGGISGGLFTSTGLQVNGAATITGVLTCSAVNASGTVTGNGLTALATGIAIYAPNGDIATKNSTVNGTLLVSGNATANLFVNNGTPGARVQAWGGDWGFLTFAMISGGYLGASPDNGVSGFNYAPNASWSDARLKTDISNTEVDALAAVCATPVRSFTWNERGRELVPGAKGRVPIGLVADEVEAVMPFVVTAPLADHAPIGDMRQIEGHRLVPYLVRAIQQLADRLDALETK